MVNWKVSESYSLAVAVLVLEAGTARAWVVTTYMRLGNDRTARLWCRRDTWLLWSAWSTCGTTVSEG